MQDHDLAYAPKVFRILDLLYRFSAPKQAIYPTLVHLYSSNALLDKEFSSGLANHYGSCTGGLLFRVSQLLLNKLQELHSLPKGKS